MKVLVVAPDLPYPPNWGFGMRVYQLTRALAAHHQVTMVCYARPGQQEETRALGDLCQEVKTIVREPHLGLRRRLDQARSLTSTTPYHSSALRSARMQAVLDECLQGDDYDVVQIESSQMSGFQYRTTAPLIVDEHNIESELLDRVRRNERMPLRRAFNRWEAAKYHRLEDRAWSAAQACVLTSERERAVVAVRRPELLSYVVPNGVDHEYFAPTDHIVETDHLVFTGVLSYRPNLAAVHHFIDNIMPVIKARRPAARLTVVGYGPAQVLSGLSREDVTVTGFVPDIRPYLANAAAVVVPIQMGGGTRLKVLEAMSMARPIVTTALGCEGIAVQDGEHLLVADRAEDFAQAVCQLLENPERAEVLGQHGRALVKAHYSWDRSGDALLALHERLVGEPRTGHQAIER